MHTADYSCAGRLHFVVYTVQQAQNITTGCMPELHEQMQAKQHKPHLTKCGKLQIVNEVDETGSDHSVKQWASIKVLELARSCVFYDFGHLGFGCRQIE